MGTSCLEKLHLGVSLGLVFFVCFAPSAQSANYAKSVYFMDSNSDCYFSGYLLVGNDGVINIHARNSGSTSSQVLVCTIRFKPEDDRNIVDIKFQDFRISDPDVTLRVDLQGGGTHTLKAGSNPPNEITSEGGMATVALTRLSYDDHDYSFHIVIRVYKKDDGMMGDNDSRGAVGLIAGIIAGVIVFLVFLAIVGVCCFRRKKEQHMARTQGRDYKAEFANESMSPSHSYGIDNSTKQGIFAPRRNPDVDYDSENNSPRLKQKPLISQRNDSDFRDRSSSESDSKEPYVTRSYGRSPQDKSSNPYIMRDYDKSPTKKVNMTYEDERPWRETRKRNGSDEYETQENNQARNTQRRQNSPSRSPTLNSQHLNPRFRQEGNAPRRTDELRGESSGGSLSDTSSREAKRHSGSFHQDTRLPPKSSSKSSPPPPRTPKTSRSDLPRNNSSQASLRQGKTRNGQPRPVSSSSTGTGQSSDGKERINVYLGESPAPSSQEKPDTRHTLKPDRARVKKTPEKRNQSPDSVKRVPTTPTDSKPPKSTKDKSKSSKSNKTNGSKQDASEYEGRFKKADSARKSKAKTPRIGRSRSAGNALDDTESIGRGSVSSAGGYRAVPSVTADDYEDSDMESNYNPLRRTGSKTSLYASRSSLYGRRRRKNSIGESVYSNVYDDPDYFDRGSYRDRSLSRRHRGFKSLGDIEMELRDQETRSTQTLRETASQTRSRSRKNSVSSTSGRSRSRDRRNSVSARTGRPKRAKSESELRRKAREAEEDQEPRRPRTPRDKPKPSPKPKPKPKPLPRKSTTTSMDDDDKDSTWTKTTATPSAQPMNPAMAVYAPHPGYMVGYPPQMPYIPVGGQPQPMMMPYGVVRMPPAGAVVPNPGAPGPGTAPNPSVSKWDMLCQMTDGAKEGDDESVAGSVFTNTYSYQ